MLHNITFGCMVHLGLFIVERVARARNELGSQRRVEVQPPAVLPLRLEHVDLVIRPRGEDGLVEAHRGPPVALSAATVRAALGLVGGRSG